MVSTPRLWERNPARPAPLQSLPGCRIPFIQQTSVCSAPALLGHSGLVPGSSGAAQPVAAGISYMEPFCFPEQCASSPHALFGVRTRKLTPTVTHGTQC